MNKKITDEELMYIISKEELYDLYITQNKTKKEICQLLNITQCRMVRLIELYKLNKKVEKHKKCQISKEILNDLYINQNLSILEIGEILEVSKSTITRHIKKYELFKSKELKIACEERLCLKRTGFRSYAKLPEVQAKMKATNLERYGAENVYASEYGKKKIEETNLKRYGVKTISSLSEVQQKVKQTKLKRYGDENYNNHEKAVQTFIENYGVDNPLKNKEICTKVKQTNLKKYGYENPMQDLEVRKKSKQTKLERYGDSGYHNPEKAKQTNTKRYGVEHYSQTDEYKEQYKQTLLEHYGTENPMQCPDIRNKAWATKKARGTTNTSKSEDQIAAIIAQSYPDVLRNHQTDVYPYYCDFYIPSQDLYIEYQGHQSHGYEPYDFSNPVHLQKVETWKAKAEQKKAEGKTYTQYDKYVEVWTQRDPKKRRVAHDNNLNWHEFFSLTQFLDWWHAQSFCE